MQWVGMRRSEVNEINEMELDWMHEIYGFSEIKWDWVIKNEKEWWDEIEWNEFEINKNK